MKSFFNALSFVLASTLFAGGCIIKHDEDHVADDGSEGCGGYGTSRGGSPSAGNSGAGGSSSEAGAGGSSGEGGSGASAGDSGTGGIVEPPPPPECVELETELSCSERADCTPVYAGTDCSCGPECTCIGGEPGCVCESFGFLVCIDAE